MYDGQCQQQQHNSLWDELPGSGSISNENLLLFQQHTDTLQTHEFHEVSVATIPFSQKLHHE